MGRSPNKKYNDPTIKHEDTDTWYRIRQRLTTVKILCADGATNKQIAKYLGVSIYTIVTYRQRYPEFDECFRLGREEVVDKLEGKMYQLAMGVVNKNITREITTEVTTQIEDEETGEITEKIIPSKKRVNIRENGIDTPDANAIQFMLKNLAPERYNVQPVDNSSDLEPVQLVDDLPEIALTDEPKLFYDDSQDGVEDNE